MQFSNQCPVSPLSSVVHDPTEGFDYEKNVAAYLDPILTSAITPGMPVVVLQNGNALSKSHFYDLARVAVSEDLDDPAAIDEWNEFLSSTLIAFHKGKMPPREWIINAYLAENKMPPPTPTVIYTAANDIIPQAKQLIANQITAKSWIASLGAYARAGTLGVSFLTDAVFTEFLAFVAAQAPAYQSLMAPDDYGMLTRLQTLSLTGELTQSISLRQNLASNDYPYSFAHVLHYFITSFISQKNDEREVCIVPFDFCECLIPRSVVFINVDAHAHARPSQINQTWNSINQALASPVRVVSTKALIAVDATQRAANKIKQATSMAVASHNDSSLLRSARVRFSKNPPKAVSITKRLQRIIQRTMNVNRSNNSYKTMVSTPNKPNRRDPDNLSLLGKTTSSRYKPDLHIYIDTSGSISEENYREAVISLIDIARKLNVSLYFNSFSHILSQTTLLPTKDRTARDIFRMFEKVPKVDGGTDFSLVWNFINASPKRKKEISVMITDFEYYPPSHHIDHPKNLYYMPVSRMNWSSICSEADMFCNGMRVHDPSIRKHLLF